MSLCYNNTVRYEYQYTSDGKLHSVTDISSGVGYLYEYDSEGIWSCTDEVKELSGYFADRHDNLRASLTDEQREVLDKLNDCQTELEDIAERALFAYAFKLGMRLAIEVFYPHSPPQS